jgi:hypothetical protein
MFGFRVPGWIEYTPARLPSFGVQSWTQRERRRPPLNIPMLADIERRNRNSTLLHVRQRLGVEATMARIEYLGGRRRARA